MKKSSFFLTAVSALLLWSGQATATEHYISTNVGIPSYLDMDAAQSNYNADDDNYKLNENFSLNKGFILNGAIGIDYGDFRIEGEVGYQTFSIGDLKVHAEGVGDVLPDINHIDEMDDDIAYDNTETFDLDGNGHILSLLVNGYYDIPVSKNIKPYVTTGIGIANIRFSKTAFYDDHNFNERDSDATALAYQFGAGVLVPVSGKVDIDARYRYFGTTNFEADIVRINADTSLQTHQFLLGMKVGI